MSTDACLFCRIIAGEIPVSPILETSNVLAFADLNPQAPTHILLVHKQHSACFSESSDLLLAELFPTVRELAQQQNLSDYRLVVNNGEKAGQSVFHLHVHLLAGRPFQWPPG
jgi:histidine triad (HIT) family protein